MKVEASHRSAEPDRLVLIAYESLTSHGFALPCFGSSAGANALFVGIASLPGDPNARIAAFESYVPEAVYMLPASNELRQISVGDPWVDVFEWAGRQYLGTKAEIWKAVEPISTDIARAAPLTFLNLIEGIEELETAPFARAAFDWLTDNSGCEAAAYWQTDVYLKGILKRDYQRLFSGAQRPANYQFTKDVELVLQSNNVILRIARSVGEFCTAPSKQLPAFQTACDGFGLSIVLETFPDQGAKIRKMVPTSTLLMRVRRGRGKTQTQIPFRAIDSFFGSVRTVSSAATGTVRAITLSRSGDTRNTMKLQLSEMANLEDPVVRFIREGDAISYQIHDATSVEGEKIMSALNAGLLDGSTKRTAGKATWWRQLQS